MSQPRKSPPTEWFHGGPEFCEPPVYDAGNGIYYWILPRDPQDEPLTGKNVWVFHWHTPKGHANRWQIAACTNHKILNPDPEHLTLDPSLACEDGCPNHGYLKDGRWEPV